MRKINIDRSNHIRAILTDTLPYEIPFFFTNEPLYVVATAHPKFEGLPDIVARLLDYKGHTKPFVYPIRKAGGSHRRLAVPHPAAQLKFAEMYRDFDAFIENICARSTYSLRFPSRVGSHFYQSQFATEQGPVESADPDPASFNRQRKWASSYFYYKNFPHIHKFFSSQDFTLLEQRFSLMMKVDISRCFESIYTHSIAWAVRGKEFSKNNKEGFFFEAEFDKRMQEANWGETNGILIGPEVSRIFAEAIMQSIDVNIKRKLGKLQSTVEIRRYVDDFFIFGNKIDDLTEVKHIIESVASEYNLHINEKKTEITSRPLISGISVARHRAKLVLRDLLKSARESLAEESAQSFFSRNFAEKVVADIRHIAKDAGVDYATLASHALAIIARGLNRLRRRIEESDAISPKYGETIIYTMIRISTFLFLMDIRSSTSHKLAKIFLESSIAFDKVGGGRRAFEGALLDSLRLVLEQARSQKITGPEIINVLVASDAVCRCVRGVSEEHLRSALDVTSTWQDKVKLLNYFELTAVLYFARNQYSFDVARNATIQEIESRIKAIGPKLGMRTEETMLFFDFLSCPYIAIDRRRVIFETVIKAHGSNVNQTTSNNQFDRIRTSLNFTAWEGAKHFQAMLERRELQPAYDS